ncbi:MAG: phosphatase PAP2 family protein [Actinomycetota bacterium]|nr:phosphatase PAP2 family protein [Actinomycetota bacterium]
MQPSAPATSAPARLLTAVSLAWVAAGAWAVFAVMSLLVAVDATQGVDDVLQRAAAAVARRASQHASWLRGFSLDVARLGSVPVAAVVLVVVVVAFTLWRRNLWPAVLLGATFVGVGLSVGGLKDLYHRPEPYDRAGALGFSYPSGHTAVAIAVWGGAALLIMLFTARRPSRAATTVAVLSAGVSVVVALAMIARSAHWVSDIIGGAALGIAWLATITVALLVAGWQPARRRRSAETNVPVGATEPVGVDEDERRDHQQDDAPAPAPQGAAHAHGRRHVPLR